MSDTHSLHSSRDREDSSDSEDRFPQRSEYSLAAAEEPAYASPERRERRDSDVSGNSDGEGRGSRGRESPVGSVSDRSDRSGRRSISRRDSDDDRDGIKEEDESCQRHVARVDVYENYNELTAYDKVLDDIEDSNNNYSNISEVQEKGYESDDEDVRERSRSRSGSRSSRRSSNVDEADRIVDEYYEAVPASSDQKIDSDSERGAEHHQGHYENSPHDDSDHEAIYDELDVREEEYVVPREEREREFSRSPSPASDRDGERLKSSSSAEDFHDAPVKKSPTTPTAGGPSGKFVLRTVRNADPLHVLRNIRNTDDNNPETDELVTILRTGKENEKKKKEKEAVEQTAKQKKLGSLFTAKLVHKFEKGIESVTEQQFEQHSSDEEDKDNASPSVAHSTVYKTTVVKATVKEPTPLSPKSPTTPKSPPYSGGYQGLSYVTQTSQHQKTGLNGQASKSSSVSSEPKSPDATSAPNLKAEIEARKKAKNYVQPQKPKEPIKMFEVPEWKRQLQEKNKMKKINSGEDNEHTYSKILLNASAASLPLKVEMERLKREMAVKGKGTVAHHDTPEWARIADGTKKPIHHADINGNS